MFFADFIGLFLIMLIISVLATAFAVASAFTYYWYSRKPRLALSFMNNPFIVVAVITGCLVFGDSTKIMQAYLFFVAYFAHMYSIGIHISMYDDTFRTLFLSMGYTRQEYFWKYLLIQARWRIVDSILTFALTSSTLLLISRVLNESFPGQWHKILVSILFIALLISIMRWLYERFGNKFSKAE